MSSNKNQIIKLVTTATDQIKFLAVVVKRAYPADLSVERVYKLLIRGIEADPLSVFIKVGERLAVHQDLIDEMAQVENVSEFISHHLTTDKLPPNANDDAHMLFNMIKKLISEEQDQSKCRRYAEAVNIACNLYIDYLTIAH